MLATVPPEQRCPHCRSASKPIIAASCAATSSSSRVVTGEPSEATLLGLYSMAAKYPTRLAIVRSDVMCPT